MAKAPKFTLLIPAYNEEEIIGDTLTESIAYLKKQKYLWEILVVDDGSKDKTAKIVKKFSVRGVRLIKLTKNTGKGGALKEGVLNSRGDFIIFMDADLSVPIENIAKFLKKLNENRGVVIGSRRVIGSSIKVHQPLIRESMGRVYTFLTRLVTGVNLADFTCGFKGFEGKAGKEIFKRSVINRWSYDAEIMFLAHKLHIKIEEIPVEWINRVDSRVRLGSDVFTSFRDLLMIRLNNLQGVYD